jgi:hypothetical protein
MKYLRFADLKERGIVASWAQLRNMVGKYGFPPGVKLTPNIRAWAETEVDGWLASRPGDRKQWPANARRRHDARRESAAAETA